MSGITFGITYLYFYWFLLVIYDKCAFLALTLIKPNPLIYKDLAYFFLARPTGFEPVTAGLENLYRYIIIFCSLITYKLILYFSAIIRDKFHNNIICHANHFWIKGCKKVTIVHPTTAYPTQLSRKLFSE